MFSTLLSSLQTSLGKVFSKSLVVGSVMPILLFLGASMGLAAKLGGRAGNWAAATGPLFGASAPLAWILAVWLLAILAISMIWSGLSSFLLELLEGRHLGFLAPILYAGQVRQQADIDSKIQRYTRNLREFTDPLPGASALNAAHYQLKSDLRDARAQGMAHPHPCYPQNWIGRLSARWQNKHGMRALWRVRWLRLTGQVNTLETIKPAVEALANELRVGTSESLALDNVELLNAINDSRERLSFERLRLTNLRQFTYPTVSNVGRGETTGLRVLAPTRLGNLTRTMRSYALDRYGMDLDIFWTRLQRELQKEDSFNSTISDSKIQVDFLVSLFVLTVIFTVFWSAYCLWVQPAPIEFLLVAALGPVAARLLYLATCQNYLVFADLMRSSVDHFRFALLDDLHIRKPSGNREEVFLWRLLGGWMGYGNDVNVTFKDQS
jgi:hypothetical protein